MWVVCALLAATVVATQVEAVTVPVGVGTFQVHGFVSQAYLLTNQNDLFGNSDGGGSFDFREMALNASWRLTPSFTVAAQGLSRRAGEGEDGTPSLDYAFADLRLLSTEDATVGLRAGRLLTPLGLHNEVRDRAFLRPGILIPQSIYFDRTRDLAISGDGGFVYAERRGPLGVVTVDLEFGLPRDLNEEVEYGLFGRDAPGKMDTRFSWVGRVAYASLGNTFRLALSGGRVRMQYDPAGAGDPIPDGSLEFAPLILSAELRPGLWTLTSEYALRFFTVSGFGPPAEEFTGESCYLQIARRLFEDWEGFIRLDVLYQDRGDRTGGGYERDTGLPAHTRFARDWTLGLRWDITPRWMARAEYHRVDGTGWIPRVDNPDVFDLERRWNLVSVLLSYRF
ncbi:MAG: hypothetical protein P1P84_08785 [Deferrisomatales bacterium]|nr:hypothetical protein [Deferrisomatales bacterium]